MGREAGRCDLSERALVLAGWEGSALWPRRRHSSSKASSSATPESTGRSACQVLLPDLDTDGAPPWQPPPPPPWPRSSEGGHRLTPPTALLGPGLAFRGAAAPPQPSAHVSESERKRASSRNHGQAGPPATVASSELAQEPPWQEGLRTVGLPHRQLWLRDPHAVLKRAWGWGRRPWALRPARTGRLSHQKHRQGHPHRSQACASAGLLKPGVLQIRWDAGDGIKHSGNVH